MENNNVSKAEYIELQTKYIALLEKRIGELESQQKTVYVNDMRCPCYRYSYPATPYPLTAGGPCTTTGGSSHTGKNNANAVGGTTGRGGVTGGSLR